MTESLSPCPFCEDGGSLSEVSYVFSDINHPAEQRYYVRCDLCGCRSGDYKSRKDANHAWNNRPREEEAYQQGVYAGQETMGW